MKIHILKWNSNLLHFNTIAAISATAQLIPFQNKNIHNHLPQQGH